MFNIRFKTKTRSMINLPSECFTGTAETAALFPVDSCVFSEEKDKTCANNDDAGDALEDIKHHLDPALLNGSSGNFGSAGARSAPSTPQTTAIGPSLLAGIASECNPGASPPSSLPRSPSHSIFSKSDKGNIKQLSTSAPIMTAQAQSPEPPSPKGVKEIKAVPYKAKQKKFHRHFPAAVTDDVLNYYSCALIGDILLQGHLYITKNYFAFYSNVFGYVTKLLIPMQSVEAISKEKTARIIPNAVGIKTFEDKHVFGSLISRDATYRYMNEVWETAKKEMCDENAIPSPPPSEGLMEHVSDLSESSETREESGRESASDVTSRFRKCTNKPTENYAPVESKTVEKAVEEKPSLFRETYLKFASASRQNMFLYVTTFILIILFLSAAILLYRIGQVQNRYTQALQDNFVLSDSDDVYGELLQWQTHLHSKSAGAVHSFLDTNLDQIAKVRQSLEALSTLLIPNGHGGGSTTAANPIDTDNS
ncbi:uncharacterized protein [Atheta coriaria]|uniref:uncharacterized protein isoform X3 n=1 Tax=Dalotia coriaria TaxID=877792 RepID=UPI0031F35E51